MPRISRLGWALAALAILVFTGGLAELVFRCKKQCDPESFESRCEVGYDLAIDKKGVYALTETDCDCSPWTAFGLEHDGVKVLVTAAHDIARANWANAQSLQGGWRIPVPGEDAAIVVPTWSPKIHAFAQLPTDEVSDTDVAIAGYAGDQYVSISKFGDMGQQCARATEIACSARSAHCVPDPAWPPAYAAPPDDYGRYPCLSQVNGTCLEPGHSGSPVFSFKGGRVAIVGEHPAGSGWKAAVFRMSANTMMRNDQQFGTWLKTCAKDPAGCGGTQIRVSLFQRLRTLYLRARRTLLEIFR